MSERRRRKREEEEGGGGAGILRGVDHSCNVDNTVYLCFIEIIQNFHHSPLKHNLKVTPFYNK